MSLITHDLGLILELAGGFSATALAYIFRTLLRSRSPPLVSPHVVPFAALTAPVRSFARAAAACFLQLSGSGPKSGQTRLAAYACCVFGVAVMVLSTVGSIRKALKGGP